MRDALELEIVREAKASKKNRRSRPKKKRFLIKDFVSELLLDEEAMEFTLTFDQSRACPKPLEIVNAVSGLSVGEYSIEKLETRF